MYGGAPRDTRVFSNGVLWEILWRCSKKL